MKAMRYRRGQILIILFAPLLFGGGAATVLTHVQGSTPRELTKTIKKGIADEMRQEAAVAVVKEWDKAISEQDKAQGKLRKQVLKTVMRDDANRSETVPLTGQMDALIRESDRSFLDMRFGVKAQATRAEWDAAASLLNK